MRGAAPVRPVLSHWGGAAECDERQRGDEQSSASHTSDYSCGRRSGSRSPHPLIGRGRKIAATERFGKDGTFGRRDFARRPLESGRQLLGISFSTIRLTVKLAAFWRGGNFLKLSSHS